MKVFIDSLGVLFRGGSEILTVTSDGKVGVGTTTPGGALSVQGGVDSSASFNGCLAAGGAAAGYQDVINLNSANLQAATAPYYYLVASLPSSPACVVAIEGVLGGGTLDTSAAASIKVCTDGSKLSSSTQLLGATGAVVGAACDVQVWQQLPSATYQVLVRAAPGAQFNLNVKAMGPGAQAFPLAQSNASPAAAGTFVKGLLADAQLQRTWGGAVSIPGGVSVGGACALGNGANVSNGLFVRTGLTTLNGGLAVSGGALNLVGDLIVTGNITTSANITSGGSVTASGAVVGSNTGSGGTGAGGGGSGNPTTNTPISAVYSNASPSGQGVEAWFTKTGRVLYGRYKFNASAQSVNAPRTVVIGHSLGSTGYTVQATVCCDGSPVNRMFVPFVTNKAANSFTLRLESVTYDPSANNLAYSGSYATGTTGAAVDITITEVFA